MADDNNQRPYRPNEARAAPQAGPAGGNDPLAELARLIGQTDPFAEFGREGSRRAAPATAPEPQTDWPAQSTNPAFAKEHAAQPAETFDQTPARQPEPQPYGAPNYEPQPYAGSPYASAAGLYRTSAVTAYPDGTTEGEGYGGDPVYQDEEHGGEGETMYDDMPPPRRRMGIIAIAAVFALAVVGTAGAIGYRALFGSSGSHMPPPVIKADITPSKIVPSVASKEPGKTITDRVGDNGKNEKLVSREEQPVAMNTAPAAPVIPPNPKMQQSAPLMPPNGSGIITAEPKKIHTIAIRPDQVGMADTGMPEPPTAAPAPMKAEAPVEAPAPAKPAVEAAPVASAPPPAESKPAPAPASAIPEPRPVATARRAPPPAPVHHAPAVSNAPLSLNPNAAPPAPARAATRTASVAAPERIAPPASSGGYAVQVSAQRSEAEAEASFRSIQAKYPTELGGRKPIIHRVDLGAKGIYYRAMVGPFASSAEASALCSKLKAAGGACIIQKI
jgi:hypothetical protein